MEFELVFNVASHKYMYIGVCLSGERCVHICNFLLSKRNRVDHMLHCVDKSSAPGPSFEF